LVCVSIIPQDPVDFGQPIRGELKVSITAGVSIRLVCCAIRIDLDRGVRPEIPADSGDPSQVVGGIFRVVADCDSDTLHDEGLRYVTGSFPVLYGKRSRTDLLIGIFDTDGRAVRVFDRPATHAPNF
jgi:hypothetical protein